jgi:hypothetical protein
MSAPAGRFLDVAKRFHEILGADGVGSEWEQRSFAVHGVEPRWVLLPATVEECAAALRACHEHELSVVPAGSGFRLGQGSPPRRLDVVLSVGRMSRVVEHAAADMTRRSRAPGSGSPSIRRFPGRPRSAVWSRPTSADRSAMRSEPFASR